MNWLGITVLAILLIGMITGLAKGAIKITVSLVASVLTFVLVFFATPYVSGAITELTPIQDVLETKITQTIMGTVSETLGDGEDIGYGDEAKIRSILQAVGVTEEELAEHGISVQDIAEGKVGSEELMAMGISRNVLDGMQNVEPEVIEQAELPRDKQIELIQNADIPNVFKELLLTNNNSSEYEKLGVVTFFEYIDKYMAKVIVNIIAFLLTLLVVMIVFRAILYALNVIEDLPVLGLLNRLAGGVLGIGGALLVIWVIFVVITLLYTTSIGEELFRMIEGNELLTFLYEWNPIMRLATSLRG